MGKPLEQMTGDELLATRGERIDRRAAIQVERDKLAHAEATIDNDLLVIGLLLEKRAQTK